MPYILKPNKLYVKDPNGDGYLPQNVVTNASAEDEIEAIEAAGAEVISSIPIDYTTLTESVVYHNQDQTLDPNNKQKARQNISATHTGVIDAFYARNGQHPETANEGSFATVKGVTFTTNGLCVTANGTSSTGIIVSLLGSRSYISGGVTKPSATMLSEGPFELISGHVYHLRLKLVSGTRVPDPNESSGGNPTQISLYDSNGDAISGAGCYEGKERYFVANTNEIGQFCLFVYKNNIFTNAVYTIEFVDVTSTLDEELRSEKYLSASAYFTKMLCGAGAITINAKRLAVCGNYASIDGSVSSGYTGFAMFNIVGNIGGVSGTHSAANVKALFTNGYYATLPDDFLDPNATGLKLTVAFEKVVAVSGLDWGLGIFTYNETDDIISTGLYKSSIDTYGMGDSGIFSVQLKNLSDDFINVLRANKNLAVVLYGRNATQYSGNSLRVRWDLCPIIEETPLNVPVSGVTPVISAVGGSNYICGTLDELTFTPSTSGICSVRFTAGSSMVLSLPNTVKMPDWWSSSSLVAGRTYEISIEDGVYGVVASWA